METGFTKISLGSYVELHLQANPGTDREDLVARLRSALDAHRRGERCPCGSPIWVIGSAAVGHACFSCITGEASPDQDYEIDVAMNVGPGVYRAQAVAWDTEKNRELTRGPATIIGVEKALGSSGRVFGDPRIRLLSP